MNILIPIMNTLHHGVNKYRGMEPVTRKFLKQLTAADSKPVEELTPTQARKVLSDLQVEVERSMAARLGLMVARWRWQAIA